MSFREKLLQWDTTGSQNMSQELQQELTGIVNDAYNKAKNLDELNLQGARAAFYLSYWQDFQERVLEGISQCRKASSLYSEAIERYQKIYENDTITISEEDAYILIELSHWLTNRDAGPEHHGGFDGYGEAIKLLRILNSDSTLDDEIKYNVLVSLGVAQFGQKKNYVSAASTFQAALDLYPESSDVTYNLGSMEAYQGNYTQAISYYDLAISRDSFAKLTPDIVNRDLGFAYILQEMIEDPSGQSSRYEKAVSYFDSIILSTQANPSLQAVAHTGKAVALYHMDETIEIHTELAKGGYSKFDKFLIQMTQSGEKDNPAIIDLIKQISFGNIVPHDQEEDPILDIYHSLFYCADADIRIN